MVKRPDSRKSHTYRIYCLLVCAMKLHHSKRFAVELVASEVGAQRRVVKDVYDRFIRQSIASGVLVKDLY